MNATELSEKLKKLADEYKIKADDKKLDNYVRSWNAGMSMGYHMANKELLENMIKGDIK